MLHVDQAFSGFSVDDLAKAKAFYADVLGMTVTDDHGALNLAIGGGKIVYVYQKDDHVPATYTCLNFPVDNIDSTVEDLVGAGISFERYEMTDDKGVFRGLEKDQGPDIAWFKDPAGNIISVMQLS